MLNLRQSIKNFFDSDEEKCKICNKNTMGRDYLCLKCFNDLKKESGLKKSSKVFYSFLYENEIRDIILDYKKNFNKDLSFLIARLIRKDLNKIIELLEIDVVIPVPLSKKRFIERGFNQISLILDILRIDYEEIKKIKDTKYMFELKTFSDRKENIKDAFYIDLNLNNKNVLIIDDIVTSGSTINEIEKTINSKYKVKNLYFYSITKVKSYR